MKLFLSVFSLLISIATFVVNIFYKRWIFIKYKESLLNYLKNELGIKKAEIPISWEQIKEIEQFIVRLDYELRNESPASNNFFLVRLVSETISFLGILQTVIVGDYTFSNGASKKTKAIIEYENAKEELLKDYIDIFFNNINDYCLCKIAVIKYPYYRNGIRTVDRYIQERRQQSGKR